MATQIERKRRRRRKAGTPAVCLFGASDENQNSQLNQAATSRVVDLSQREPSSIFNSAPESGGHQCESQDGIKQQHQQQQQACRLQPADQNYQPRRTSVRLTSAIHMMGQNRRRPCSSSNPLSSPLSLLSLLLLISVAFTLTLSLLPSTTNLILLAQATSSNNHQQQQQPAFGGAGNSVIVAPATSGKARYKTMYACEDRQLTMDCDFGSKINLIRANYGRFSITQCNEQGQLELSTDCMSPITFRIMRERCQDKQKCSVNATSAIFGDKCPKTRKYLEVHFQCQPDPRQQLQPPVTNYDQPDRVDLRNSSLSATPATHIIYPGPSTTSGTGTILKPPNNPTIVHSNQHPPMGRPQPTPVSDNQLDDSTAVQMQPQQIQHQPQQHTVMNSEILDYNAIAVNDPARANGYNANNNISAPDEQIIVTLRHSHIENMSNPRCVSWDPTRKEWTQKGSRLVDTNSTHTVCAYDQATSYMLVMDHHSSPNPSISQQPNHQPISMLPVAHLPVPPLGPLDNQKFLETHPIILVPEQHSANQDFNGRTGSSSSTGSSFVRSLTPFGYVVAFAFAIAAFITIAFIASNMRQSGTTLKSLGNFTAFGGPKYKNRRVDEGLHNKDLLVINNQNGHQFLYAPANTTKINSSSSTHILSAGLANQHQGTLHHHIQQQQLQQQQMYSGNGTLSNLSGTGGQSNYYYGLMGSLFQQQQQQQQQSQLQHHLSTHHLNQQHQMQQGLQAASYQHQANKSTISNESSNSTPSSSGVESASTSLHQQQQQQQQPQSCLMMNSEYNLMGQVSNYNQHQTLLSAHPYQHQQQPQLTLNAHYSSSGPMNLSQQQQQQQRQLLMNSSNLLREHIYESVDDDKQQCMARGVLLPAADQSEQLFSSNTLSQMQAQANNQQQANLNRAMTLSSRLQQQQQQQQQQQPLINSQTNKRLLSHPAIVRENQTKTNIICSKLAQVTPQRATEINKFQHDIMAIFNGTNDTTTTTTTTTAASSTSSPLASNFGRPTDLAHDLGLGGGSKVSTDC